MNKLVFTALLLLLPQLAAARVYMCVDDATGQTSFTDQACDSAGVREEVRVPPSNLNSGRHYAAPSKQKTWRSQTDTRKTGTDYNTDRRRLFESNATAAAAQ